jgi:hypothetical protein
MDTNTLSLIISLVALVVALGTFFLWNQQNNKKPAENTESFSTRPTQLQAYERLAILAERLSLSNLVSRNYRPNISAKEMQMVLIENIRQEYDHNISQQIFVSQIAWDTINKLKDQNLLIINQVAATLSAEASGNDLNKAILDFTMMQNSEPLHKIVLEAISFEAKKLMK